MSKIIKGICALTKDECEMRDSFIYIKFIYNYLKKKGGNRFRSMSNPNEVLQDGWKERLLGEYAEQEFSIREKWFAETIFQPFSQGLLKTSKVEYGTELYYFCVSLLWRVLYMTIDSIIGEDYRQKCHLALEEWRVFLNGGCLPPTYNRIYLMPILPESFDPIPQKHFTHSQWNEIEWYIRRDFDSALCDTIPNNSVFFCKMPLFFFWAVIDKDCTAPNYGLRIKPEGGRIDFKRYHLGDSTIKSFILLRIILSSQKVEEIANNMSENQQNKIVQRTIHDEHLLNSELGYLLLQKGKY